MEMGDEIFKKSAIDPIPPPPLLFGAKKYAMMKNELEKNNKQNAHTPEIDACEWVAQIKDGVGTCLLYSIRVERTLAEMDVYNSLYQRPTKLWDRK